jgi:hypothetical protein
VTAGLSAVNLANKWLDMLGGTAFTAPAAFWVQLHKGDPGAAGTANTSAVTTRQQITWSAASGGSKSQTSAPGTWSMTTTETISYVSFWTASTSGTFLDSASLTSPASVNNGDTVTLTTLTIAFSPIAA